ncbi:phosphatidylglycerophosphatase A [Candidatus Fermentibacterales bacterium]|nr:phosphatidylglycerophosphatase A [Candidatus Fermentibacterales bacterium]
MGGLRSRLGLAVATTLGTGFLPVAPGTAGAAMALAVFWFSGLRQAPWFVPWLLMALLVPLGFAGCVAGRSRWGKDPGRVNVDEFAGAWLCFCVAGPSRGLMVILASFVLFRALDVLKPWPVRAADNHDSAAGILLDDLIAGAMAGSLVRLGDLAHDVLL